MLSVQGHERSNASPNEPPPWQWRWGWRDTSGPVVDQLPRIADAWAFTPSTAVLLRPGTWRFDENQQLHDTEDGSALDWGAWTASFHHGVLMPEWSRNPLEITIDRIVEETNAEVRRALVERYGVDRFIADHPQAKLIDDDPVRGQLWDLGFGPSYLRRAIFMLRVIDATPTPAGDHKVYWLLVPPTMRRAQQAVAWTFGMEPAEYAPEVET